jgi:uncharacterized protein YeaO (DUF488 family)
MPVIKLKRAYEKPSTKDGERILVERLWPRGITKQAARVDLWMKDIAPSTELRKWFAHDTDKWAAFCARYRSELKEKTELINQLRKKAKATTITFVYSARDTEHNSALLLKEFIEKTKR